MGKITLQFQNGLDARECGRHASVEEALEWEHLNAEGEAEFRAGWNSSDTYRAEFRLGRHLALNGFSSGVGAKYLGVTVTPAFLDGQTTVFETAREVQLVS